MPTSLRYRGAVGCPPDAGAGVLRPTAWRGDHFGDPTGHRRAPRPGVADLRHRRGAGGADRDLQDAERPIHRCIRDLARPAGRPALPVEGHRADSGPMAGRSALVRLLGAPGCAAAGQLPGQRSGVDVRYSPRSVRHLRERTARADRPVRSSARRGTDHQRLHRPGTVVAAAAAEHGRQLPGDGQGDHRHVRPGVRRPASRSSDGSTGRVCPAGSRPPAGGSCSAR